MYLPNMLYYCYGVNERDENFEKEVNGLTFAYYLFKTQQGAIAERVDVNSYILHLFFLFYSAVENKVPLKWPYD